MMHTMMEKMMQFMSMQQQQQMFTNTSNNGLITYPVATQGDAIQEPSRSYTQPQTKGAMTSNKKQTTTITGTPIISHMFPPAPKPAVTSSSSSAAEIIRRPEGDDATILEDARQTQTQSDATPATNAFDTLKGKKRAASDATGPPAEQRTQRKASGSKGTSLPSPSSAPSPPSPRTKKSKTTGNKPGSQ
jgi:hypothetical protein